MATIPAPIQVNGTAATSAYLNNSAIESSAQYNKNLQNSFWQYSVIDYTRWNKSYPYMLRLYRQTPTGTQPPAPGGWVSDDSIIPPFYLPIPPEQMTLSTPWAIVTTPTLGGIIEEHNGSPIRMLQISGTTGVLPLRGNPQANINIGSFQGIFAGTLQGVNQVNVALQAFIGQPPAISNVVDDTAGYGSGYVQFMLLRRFLEAYTSLKQTAAGRDYVLAFCSYKDQEIYLVSPQTFDMHRGGQSPWEYSYTLAFKVWRRVNPNQQQPSPYQNQPPARSPNMMAQILNGLQSAQQVMQGAKAILQGIQADVQNTLFEPIRQATLFVKSFLGVIVTAADLPANIITDLQEPILEAISVQGTVNQTFLNVAAVPQNIVQAWINLSVATQKAASGASQTAYAAPGLQGAAPAVTISLNPLDNYIFFSAVQPSGLNLRPNTVTAIQNEYNRNQRLQRQDFELMVENIQALLYTFEATVGLGDPTFTETFNLPVVVPTRVPTPSDFQIIFSLNQALLQLEALAASATINQNQLPAVNYIAGLANQSGIAFKVPVGKFQVPFQYGSTLEIMASQYLGDPNRWMEIAALNGLSDPYVDETGFTVPFVANGNDNSFSIASSTQFFTNQLIWISSNSQKRISCHVIAIQVVSPTLSIIYTDTTTNLGLYRVQDAAFVQAFAPNTTNSLQSLYIPSAHVPDNDDFQEISIPGVNYFDPLIQVGGIDLLLTQDNDLVITPDGGGRLAVGLQNIVQKVRLVLTTPLGQLLHHPQYGFPLKAGDSVADNSAQNILNVCKTLFIGDPTFSGVNFVQVVVKPPAAAITLGVGIAGTGKVIPITVNVPI